MTAWKKALWVCGGYALAMAAAVIAGMLYDARLAKLPYDTSGGMYAGGQFIASLAAFLLVAMAPTLLWAWFLWRAGSRAWRRRTPRAGSRWWRAWSGS